MVLDDNNQCKSCGRDFKGDAELNAGDKCPSDDCPSHWEEKWIPNPSHPNEKLAAIPLRLITGDERAQILKDNYEPEQQDMVKNVFGIPSEEFGTLYFFQHADGEFHCVVFNESILSNDLADVLKFAIERA